MTTRDAFRRCLSDPRSGPQQAVHDTNKLLLSRRTWLSLRTIREQLDEYEELNAFESWSFHANVRRHAPCQKHHVLRAFIHIFCGL